MTIWISFVNEIQGEGKHSGARTFKNWCVILHLLLFLSAKTESWCPKNLNAVPIHIRLRRIAPESHLNLQWTSQRFKMVVLNYLGFEIFLPIILIFIFTSKAFLDGNCRHLIMLLEMMNIYMYAHTHTYVHKTKLWLSSNDLIGTIVTQFLRCKKSH